MNLPQDRASAPAAWRATLVAWRNQLLANPRFRRWAARFPLTRPHVRREAQALFDLCAGFVYSQVLFACVRLRLFEQLAERPLGAEALSSRLGLSVEATHRLLDAAMALQLVERVALDCYTLGTRGAVVLAEPGIAAMVEHHAMLYRDLAEPETLLRDATAPTQIGRYWSYARNQDARALAPQEIADYSALMALSQPLVAEQVLAAYAFERHRCVLDVGGGEGAFLLEVARHTRRPRLMLFDLPGVTERARQRIDAAGFADRIQIVPGDFFADPLPTGADLVTMVRVIHDHDDEQALSLLRAARRCLPADGALLLAEPMAGPDASGRASAAYFGFYLLAMRSGLPRTPQALSNLLVESGFEPPRLLAPPVPLQARILLARVRA